jgi:hypothetical protein
MMEELAVIPECFVDTCLTETITNAEHFNHQKGCNAVSKLMQEKFPEKFALGIVDKDKQLLSYLKEFDLLGTKASLFLYKHKSKHHYIIQIYPAIEEFILKSAKASKLKLSNYGLPDDLKQLTKITKQKTMGNQPQLKQL